MELSRPHRQFSLSTLFAFMAATCVILWILQIVNGLFGDLRSAELVSYFRRWTSVVFLQGVTIAWAARSHQQWQRDCSYFRRRQFVYFLAIICGAIPLLLWVTLMAMLLGEHFRSNDFLEFVGNVALLLCFPGGIIICTTFFVPLESRTVPSLFFMRMRRAATGSRSRRLAIKAPMRAST